jgi:hypothetical protein
VFLPSDHIRVYVIALYFIIQTVTTVGYGDVNPTNSLERLFVIAIMIIGVVSFSFIAGSLTSLVQDFDSIMSENKSDLMRLAIVKTKHLFPAALTEKLEMNIIRTFNKGDKESDEQWLINRVHGTSSYKDVCDVVFSDFGAFKFIMNIPQQQRYDFLYWL